MMFSPRRLFLGTGMALIALALLLATYGSRGAAGVSAIRRAAIATRQLDSLISGRADSTHVLALGYLERARLGMGSPFRLVDQAAHDPRLPDSSRSQISWAILDRVLKGEIYQIDPSVLDDIGTVGAAHLALIERTIADADDPRVAELSLRMAYALASADGTLSMTSLPTVIEVTSQIRDRVLARRDLDRAIRRADAEAVNLVEEIMRLRASRGLDVERPLLATTGAVSGDDAIAGVAHLVREIESVAVGDSAKITSPPSPLDVHQSIVLARLGARLPPMAATRVTVNSRAGMLRGDSSLSAAATQFLVGATNEETFVAAYAFANATSGGRSPGNARVMLTTAVALRAMAQEPVWFPGMVTASAGAVVGRFGLRAIDFDADVPTSWRPYYVQMVASAFDDMTRVFPAYEPTNLTVRVGMQALQDSALAMHDPRTHTLRLSAWSSSGTFAHELAHDIDWQAARRLFSRVGGYATDRAIVEKGVALTTSVQALTAARSIGRGRPASAVSNRPAEVFARSVDWFVSDELARQGRSNGYLSAIQEPFVAGFAATRGDAASLDAAGSLINSLAQMTYLPDTVGAAYLSRWQSLDALEPTSLLQRVLDMPVSVRRGVPAPLGVSAPTMTSLATRSLCRLDELHDGSPRDRLIAMGIEARAKGIVLRRARYTPEDSRPAWAHAILGELLWDSSAADDVIARTRAGVVESAGRAGLVALPPAPFRPDC